MTVVGDRAVLFRIMQIVTLAVNIVLKWPATKISGEEVRKAAVSGGARFPVVSEQAISRSALTFLEFCTNHR